jgi:hypothetical protein
LYIVLIFAYFLCLHGIFIRKIWKNHEQVDAEIAEIFKTYIKELMSFGDIGGSGGRLATVTI